jgi:hypothetical protein
MMHTDGRSEFMYYTRRNVKDFVRFAEQTDWRDAT